MTLTPSPGCAAENASTREAHPKPASQLWLTPSSAGLRLRKRSIGDVPLQLLLLRAFGAQRRRLLLLRAFGAQRRSEQLLHRLGASWRRLGPVQMITGPDLTTATKDPKLGEG